MAARVFKHSLTGRQVRAKEGTRLFDLFVGDENYTEVKPKKEGGDDGSGSEGGRRSSSRKGSRSRRDSEDAESAG